LVDEARARATSAKQAIFNPVDVRWSQQFARFEQAGLRARIGMPCRGWYLTCSYSLEIEQLDP
jgi:hypothetical protein